MMRATDIICDVNNILRIVRFGEDNLPPVTGTYTYTLWPQRSEEKENELLSAGCMKYHAATLNHHYGQHCCRRLNIDCMHRRLNDRSVSLLYYYFYYYYNIIATTIINLYGCIPYTSVRCVPNLF